MWCVFDKRNSPFELLVTANSAGEWTTRTHDEIHFSVTSRYANLCSSSSRHSRCDLEFFALLNVLGYPSLTTTIHHRVQHVESQKRNSPSPRMEAVTRLSLHSSQQSLSWRGRISQFALKRSQPNLTSSRTRLECCMFAEYSYSRSMEGQRSMLLQIVRSFYAADLVEILRFYY